MIYIFILLFSVVFFLIWFFVRFSYFYKVTTPKGEKYKSSYKSDGFLKKLFWSLPMQLGKDFARKDSNFFDAHGCIVFEGHQGGGKTISAVQYARELKRKYKESIVLSNTSLAFEDISLSSWEPILEVDNDKYGVICLLDEAQLWFSGRFMSNFNISSLGLISQNRKCKRVLLLTSQNFCQLDKQVRINTTEVRKCKTFLGCLTVVACFVPELDSEGNVIKQHFKRFYWYVQDDDLRNSYDTFRVIQTLTKSGFIERKE